MDDVFGRLKLASAARSPLRELRRLLPPGGSLFGAGGGGAVVPLLKQLVSLILQESGSRTVACVHALQLPCCLRSYFPLPAPPVSRLFECRAASPWLAQRRSLSSVFLGSSPLFACAGRRSNLLPKSLPNSSPKRPFSSNSFKLDATQHKLTANSTCDAVWRARTPCRTFCQTKPNLTRTAGRRS